MQTRHPTSGKRRQSSVRASMRSSSGAAVCGIPDRKMAARLFMGSLARLSSIFVRESSARITTTRMRVFGCHARRSSDHKTAVRTGLTNEPRTRRASAGSCRTGFGRLRSSSSSTRNSSGAASANAGRFSEWRSRLSVASGVSSRCTSWATSAGTSRPRPSRKTSFPVHREQHQGFADAGPQSVGIAAHVTEELRARCVGVGRPSCGQP